MLRRPGAGPPIGRFVEDLDPEGWLGEWPDSELDVLAMTEAEAAGDIVAFGAVARNTDAGTALAVAVKLLAELARETTVGHTLPPGFRRWAAQAMERP